MARKNSKFSPEFREEAARMVVETSRAIADVARELGVSETSLGNWVRAYREKHAEDEPPLQRNWIGLRAVRYSAAGSQGVPVAAWVSASSAVMPCLAAVDR